MYANGHGWASVNFVYKNRWWAGNWPVGQSLPTLHFTLLPFSRILAHLFNVSNVKPSVNWEQNPEQNSHGCIISSSFSFSRWKQSVALHRANPSVMTVKLSIGLLWWDCLWTCLETCWDFIVWAEGTLLELCDCYLYFLLSKMDSACTAHISQSLIFSLAL